MRVAVVGGLARQAADCVWNYPGIDVTHYIPDEVHRVVASANRGGTDVVILITRFISHEVDNKVKATGIKMIRWDQGLKELSRKLPGLVSPQELPPKTNGHSASTAIELVELSWVARISEVLKLATDKTWTTREIMDKLGIHSSKQPRVSEALVKLRAAGRARAFWFGREKCHRWVPDNEVEAAREEYAAELREKLSAGIRQEIAVEASGTAPEAPSAAPEAPVGPVAVVATTDHAADLGVIWARARLAKKKAAARVIALEADLKIAREALAKAESDEAGVVAMLDDMAE